MKSNIYDWVLILVQKGDPVARKLRLRRRRDGQESEKVLKVSPETSYNCSANECAD
jgi:hypothetical protein